MPNLRRILVTLAATLGLVVTSAPASHAAPKAAPAAPSYLATRCNWLGCSSVVNRSSSESSILVARRWYSTTYNPTWKRLYPGQNSRRYWNDVNAFWIPTGCRGYDPLRGTYYGGRWYRPSSALHYSIKVTC